MDTDRNALFVPWYLSSSQYKNMVKENMQHLMLYNA